LGKETIIDVWKNFMPEKTKKDLQALWDEIYKECKDKNMTDIQAESTTNLEFGKRLRREKFSKGKREVVDYLGFILGVSRCSDTYEGMRVKARKEFNSDPQMAILKGLTDENGTPLDPRETIFGTQTNKNFHKPLIGSSYYRFILGLAKRAEEEDEPKVWIMRLRGKAAREFRFKPFVPLRFKANLRDDKKGFYDISVSKQTAFTVTRGEPIDVEAWMRKNQIWSLPEMMQAHKASEKAVDFWVFVEAYIDRIDTTVNPKTGSRTVFLSDPEKTPETLRVFVEQTVPITFGEYSKVIVVGKTNLWKRQDGTELISLNAYSIYPLEGLTLEPDVEPEFSDVSDEDSGYVIPFVEDLGKVEIDAPKTMDMDSNVETSPDLKKLENGEEEEEEE
jgi:hypothetical protein